jgi:hypothetical protein
MRLYVGVAQRYARPVFPSQKMRCNKLRGKVFVTRRSVILLHTSDGENDDVRDIRYAGYLVDRAQGEHRKVPKNFKDIPDC